MAALAVAVVLVWSASTGPTGLARGVAQHPVARGVHTQPVRHAQSREARHPTYHTDYARRLSTGLGWLDDVIGIAAFVALLLLLATLLRAVLNIVGVTLPDKQLVLDLDPLPDVAAGRDAVRRDRDRLREALHGSDVRNGIVACWVLLEEAAAEAGVLRRPAETPTEFVVRFLHTIDIDPRPVGRLAELYREARFSTHPMGEQARVRAERALAEVDDDLARTGALG